MTFASLGCLVVAASYLLGSVPFGYLIGRAKGVNILEAGSRNIGATNVGRLLGRRWGILVFVLDFTKGALPVFLAGLVTPTDEPRPDTLRVLAGVAAFVGHLWPIYLGFRGGKGVATGAGIIAVLVPYLTIAVLATWGVLLWLTRYVSLASIVASSLLFVLRVSLTRQPWGHEHLVITLFCLVGALIVVARHHANIRRLLAGTEPRV